uniref:Uncharacterized protein n=1 Tax=Steinernema glaseri TaxID=37863 RepID=A0A1I7YLJ5_9BILA
MSEKSEGLSNNVSFVGLDKKNAYLVVYVATARPGINRRRDTRPSRRDQDRKARHHQPREMNQRNHSSITAPLPLRHSAPSRTAPSPPPASTAAPSAPGAQAPPEGPSLGRSHRS